MTGELSKGKKQTPRQLRLHAQRTIKEFLSDKLAVHSITQMLYHMLTVQQFARRVYGEDKPIRGFGEITHNVSRTTLTLAN